MSKYKNAGIILALAFLVRILYLVFFNETHIGLDSQWYNQVADSIRQGQGFAVSGVPTAYTVPIYPLFLAFVYGVFGFKIEWAFALQSLIGAVNCVLIYLIARALFNEKVAVLSGLIASFYYFFIKCENMILTEAVFMPLVTLSIFLLIRTRETKGLLYTSLLALSLAIATLTRSAFVFFPLLLIGLDLFFKADIFGGGFDLKKIKRIIVFLVIFTIPIGIWTYRNYRVFNSFVPLATEAGHAFYFSYHPKDGKIFGIADPDETSSEILKNPSEVERSRLFTQAAIQRIRKNPKRTLKYIWLKNMFFWSIFDWEILGLKGIYNFSTAFILPFFLWGVILLFRSRDKTALLFLFVPILYVYLTSIAFMGLPRNRYTAEQSMIIIGAYCMIKLFESLRRKSSYLTLVSGWLVLNIYLFINSSSTKECFKLLFQRLKLW